MSIVDYPTSTTIPDHVYAWILGKAREALARGDNRVSVRKLLELARGTFQESINNNVAPDIARRLVADEPDLAVLIEMRARGRRGPNKAPRPSDLIADVNKLTNAELLAIPRIYDLMVQVRHRTIEQERARAATGAP